MAASPRYEPLLERFRKGRLLNYRNRELIVRAGEPPQGVYFIGKGFVKVYSISDQGTERIHVIYKAGEIFPLIWAFNGQMTDVFYESLGPTKLWRLPKDEFIENMHNGGYHDPVVMQFIEQFRIFSDRLENLEYTDALQRVAYRLQVLGRRFGEKRGPQIVIKAPLTHQHIAESINLTRETVSREIKKLQLLGLVSNDGRVLVIDNQAGLKQIISGKLPQPLRQKQLL